MTTVTKATVESVIAEIKTLEQVSHLIETNQGAYGAAEACKKVGTSDPSHANRNVYETVAGVRRETGPDEDRAPGRMRHINHQAMAADRKRLADLRRQLRDM